MILKLELNRFEAVRDDKLEIRNETPVGIDIDAEVFTNIPSPFAVTGFVLKTFPRE